MASYHSQGATERPDEAENQIRHIQAKRIRLALTCAIEAHARAADSVIDLILALGCEVDGQVEEVVSSAAQQMLYRQAPPRRVIARANLRIRHYMRERAEAAL